MGIPLLVVSDAPNLPSGLARITRDLCSGISQTLSKEFDLAVLGWDWDDYKPYPYPVHRIQDTDNWAGGISGASGGSALESAGG